MFLRKILIFCFCFFSIAAYANNNFKIQSKTFEDVGVIPTEITCKGKNKVPELIWSGEPQGTKSFVLTVHDPDAPNKHWVHWIVYNIPAHTHHINNDNSFTKGINSFGRAQYDGPCPPKGESHRYIFTVYALDIAEGNLPTKLTEAKLLDTIKPHILAKATLEGQYGEKNWLNF